MIVTNDILSMITGVIIMVVLIVICKWQFKKLAFRNRNTFSILLEAELSVCGFILVSSQVPPKFFTGPFPRGVTEFHGKFIFTIVSDWQYRHVIFRDRFQQEHEAWARLFFCSGEDIPEIDWMPDLSTLNGKLPLQGSEYQEKCNHKF